MMRKMSESATVISPLMRGILTVRCEPTQVVQRTRNRRRKSKLANGRLTRHAEVIAAPPATVSHTNGLKKRCPFTASLRGLGVTLGASEMSVDYFHALRRST